MVFAVIVISFEVPCRNRLIKGSRVTFVVLADTHLRGNALSLPSCEAMICMHRATCIEEEYARIKLVVFLRHQIFATTFVFIVKKLLWTTSLAYTSSHASFF